MIRQGGKSYFIQDQESPYVVHGDQWVGYDDVDSLRTKVNILLIECILCNK